MGTSTFNLEKARDTATQERRRSERRPHIVEAWVWSPTAIDPMDREEVTTVDLSRHGVAFNLPQSLPAGSFHMIEIGIGEQKIVAEIRIVTCRELENGLHQVGAEFC